MARRNRRSRTVLFHQAAVVSSVRYIRPSAVLVFPSGNTDAVDMGTIVHSAARDRRPLVRVFGRLVGALETTPDREVDGEGASSGCVGRTTVYPELSDRFSPRFGGEYRIDTVHRAELERFAGDLGVLVEEVVGDRLRALIAAVDSVRARRFGAGARRRTPACRRVSRRLGYECAGFRDVALPRCATVSNRLAETPRGCQGEKSALSENAYGR